MTLDIWARGDNNSSTTVATTSTGNGFAHATVLVRRGESEENSVGGVRHQHSVTPCGNVHVRLPTHSTSHSNEACLSLPPPSSSSSPHHHTSTHHHHHQAYQHEVVWVCVCGSMYKAVCSNLETRSHVKVPWWCSLSTSVLFFFTSRSSSSSTQSMSQVFLAVPYLCSPPHLDFVFISWKAH